MDNIVYAAAWTVEQFSGWNGVGAATYSSTTSTTISTQLYNTTTYGLNGACLWLNLGGALTSFFTRFYGFFAPNTAYDWNVLTQYATAVWHTTDNTAYLMMRGKQNTAWVSRMYLGTSLTDYTKWVDLGFDIPQPNNNSNSAYDISVSGCGTANGTISVWVNGVICGTWTGDLTAYSSFDALSFHTFLANTSWVGVLQYVYVTNYPTMKTVFSRQSISTVGSENSWVGNTTAFGAFPIDYTANNIEYGLSAGNQVSFSPGSVALSVGYEPKNVIVSVPMRAGYDNPNTAVAAFVKNTTTSAIGVANPQTISTSNASYNYVFNKDPITGDYWSLTNLNAYEFGLRRTS